MSLTHPHALSPGIAVVISAMLLAGCASANTGDGELIPDEPVRMAAPEKAVKYGDCAEALRRADAQPDLNVDRLPSPRAMVPAPIPIKSMPADVRAARYNEVRVTVLIDTLGRADMKTFRVVKTTHPWLTSSVRNAVAKWSFAPAELAGCKVPRIFKWGATAGKVPAHHEG